MYQHLFKEEFSTGFYCDTLLVGKKYGHLRKYVDDHKYIVISMLRIRKAKHIVHGDGFPGPARSRKRSIQALILNDWLGYGTGSVGLDMFSNVLFEIWSIKILLQYCHCLIYTKVSCD